MRSITHSNWTKLAIFSGPYHTIEDHSIQDKHIMTISHKQGLEIANEGLIIQKSKKTCE